MLSVAVSFVFVVVDLMQLSSLGRRQSGNQPLFVVDVDNDGLRPVFFCFSNCNVAVFIVGGFRHVLRFVVASHLSCCYCCF